MSQFRLWMPTSSAHLLFAAPRQLVLFIVLLGLIGTQTTGPANAQTPAAQTTPAWRPGQLTERVYRDEAGDHKYQVFIPQGYNSQNKSPAIVFLHGAGERGNDGAKQAKVGIGPYLVANPSLCPFVVVFPQAEDTTGRALGSWSAETADGQRVLKILDEVTTQANLDESKIALVGWSMGGYGAWNLGSSTPNRWSAIVPLSGGGDNDLVAKLVGKPVWAIHGETDSLVRPTESRRLTTALREAGGNVTYTELTGVGHDLFAKVFAQPAFYKWLQNPEADVPDLNTLPASGLAAAPLPFRPVMEIPNAATVRVGNEVLRALSYTAANRLPANALSGRLADMYDSTSVQGRSFSIQFSGLSYNGRVDRVQIRAVGTERLNVLLSLSNITLTIGGTYVSGARHAAQTGPINIVIGHVRPVALSVDVTPYLDGQRIRFRSVGASFQIPPDNWYVTQPAGISVQGFGMTEEAVSSGLTSGLYGARSRIENEVVKAAPTVAAQLEQQFQLLDLGPFLAQLWPLPVYQPRLRAKPQQISTDASGVSLVLAVEASSFDPALLNQPFKRVAPAGAGITSVPLDDKFHVAISPSMWSALSGQMIDEGLARIDVLDIPHDQFGKLADRETLSTAIPALREFPVEHELRTEFTLKQPLSVEGGREGSSGAELDFVLPKASLLVSTRKPGAGSQWSPFAEVDLQMKETLAGRLLKPNFVDRKLEVAWKGNRQINGEGRLLANTDVASKEVDGTNLAALFATAWGGWTDQSLAIATTVPDVDLGFTRLRLEDFTAAGNVLAAKFTIPKIRITNSSPEKFVYETKGPFSPWGGPFILEPGKSHEYDLPYPLTYRPSSTSQSEVYSLLVGSHSEYRVPLTGGSPRLFQAKR